MGTPSQTQLLGAFVDAVQAARARHVVATDAEIASELPGAFARMGLAIVSAGLADRPIPFASWTILRATDVDGVEHIFRVPSATLPPCDHAAELDRLRAIEKAARDAFGHLFPASEGGPSYEDDQRPCRFCGHRSYHEGDAAACRFGPLTTLHDALGAEGLPTSPSTA